MHRLELLKEWGIRPGQTVLEIGCGQGDTASVLAAAVGEEGHVTGMDPAPFDYGELLVDPHLERWDTHEKVQARPGISRLLKSSYRTGP